jgi:hypothetical protein
MLFCGGKITALRRKQPRFALGRLNGPQPGLSFSLIHRHGRSHRLTLTYACSVLIISAPLNSRTPKLAKQAPQHVLWPQSRFARLSPEAQAVLRPSLSVRCCLTLPLQCAHFLPGHPFDLTKTRLQTAAPGTYKGAIDVVKQTLARDGATGYDRTAFISYLKSLTTA